MEVDGISIVASGSALVAISGIAGAWIKARYGRKVEIAKDYVTCDQCRQHREELGRRVDAQLEMFARVSDKLDLIEAHNEDRAKRMHDRLDPVIRTTAETAGVLRQHLEDHRAERSSQK